MLISVPGSPVGPGGVLIVCEDFLIYKNLKNKKETKIFYPKRVAIDDNRGTMIISYGMIVHKKSDKSYYFCLL